MANVSFNTELKILWTVVAMVLLARSSAAPVSGGTINAITYLSQYGYLSPSLRNSSIGHMVDESSMRRAVAEFQSFFGLKATGELDEETTKIMSLPRCGVRDKVFRGSRAKRYVLQGYKWSTRSLTYKISKYPSNQRLKLSRAEVDAELARAFSVWSEYTDLTFTPKRYGNVDIEIRFEKGAHGDGDPFDGPGGTLAHAYFPNFGGAAHFDDAERWTVNSRRGINLLQVAAHEFGHSLGLEHSNVMSALMYPIYRNFDLNYRLHQDDIRGIQALYSPKNQERSDNGGGWHSGGSDWNWY